MELPPGLLHVIAKTRLFTDGLDYVILGVPLLQTTEAAGLVARFKKPFAAMIVDKDETTMILPLEAWTPLRPLLQISAESPAYRLITFDVPLDLGLVGYIATLLSTVAEQGISIFPISAFSRDHVLVPSEDFERAWDALRALIHACQEQDAA